MNYPKAIVVAAALIAGAIFFSVRAQANPSNGGKYQIVSGYAKTEKLSFPLVWRVNIETGQIVRCLVPSGAALRVVCIGSAGELQADTY